jgi:hypothetical protein
MLYSKRKKRKKLYTHDYFYRMSFVSRHSFANWLYSLVVEMHIISNEFVALCYCLFDVLVIERET